MKKRQFEKLYRLEVPFQVTYCGNTYDCYGCIEPKYRPENLHLMRFVERDTKAFGRIKAMNVVSVHYSHVELIRK